MAVRTYYGTCTTASDVSEKEVYVSDLDLVEIDTFNFEEGDLLTVFFANTNTVSSPSIVIINQDNGQEVSLIDDEGKLIKSLDIESGIEDAWAAGETVIFAYTQQSTSNTYYWELIDANHASIDIYGDTKLFDEDNLDDLLSQPKKEENSNIALTPNALKDFFELLKGQQEEEEEEEEPIIGLKWNPVEGDPLTFQKLGILSLSNNDNGVEITYPLEQKITTKVNEILGSITQYTGQLINNGNGKDGDGTAEPRSEDKPDGAEPFITRIVPDNLYFENGNGLYYNSVPKIILNNGSNKLFLDGTQGIILDAPTEVNGNLQALGIKSKNASIQVTNNNNSVMAEITSDGTVKGQILQEKLNNNFTNIRNIYGPQYKVVKKNIKSTNPKTVTVKIKKGEVSDHLYYDVDNESGWTPIGVVGYNISELESKEGQPGRMNLWECCLATHNNKMCVQYALYNMGTKENIVYVTFSILYKKII